MRVVVTGGAGFIGSHLTEQLLERGDEVVVCDMRWSRNLEPVQDHPAFEFVEGDVREAGKMQETIGSDVDLVYHLSAVVGVKHYLADPLAVIDINVGGTRNVLEAAARYGTKVILASTSEVFGKNPKVPWSEDDDRLLGSTSVDRWSYSTSKATSEHMALAMHRTRGLPVTVVRFFNAYGPRQAPHYVISQTVHKVLTGQRPLVYDDGAQTRCFTFVADAVEGTIAAALHPAADGQVFNIGNSIETSMKDAVETVIRVAGVDLGWDTFDTGDRYGARYEDIDRRVPDVTKAARILGWRARTSLEDGIRRTIQWAQENPWWLKAGLAEE